MILVQKETDNVLSCKNCKASY